MSLKKKQLIKNESPPNLVITIADNFFPDSQRFLDERLRIIQKIAIRTLGGNSNDKKATI